MNDVTAIVTHVKRRRSFFEQFCLPSIQQNKPAKILIYNDDSHPNAKRNRGLKEAKTPFIIFCDDDAILAADCLPRLQEALLSGPYSVAYCDYVGICLPGVPHPRAEEGTYVQPGQPFSPQRLEKENYIDTTSLFRKVDVPAFDESLPRFHDWDIALQMARAGKQGVYVPKTLFYSFHIDRGITASVPLHEALRTIAAKHDLPLPALERHWGIQESARV